MKPLPNPMQLKRIQHYLPAIPPIPSPRPKSAKEQRLYIWGVAAHFPGNWDMDADDYHVRQRSKILIPNALEKVRSTSRSG